MMRVENLKQMVQGMALLAMLPATAMAEWQIEGSIDVPIEGVPYNDAIEISADNDSALVTIDSTEQYSFHPAVAALERDSAGNWQSMGLLSPPASNGPNQFFGCDLSVDGDTALVGSCYRQEEQWPTDFSSNVAVYRKDNTGQWNQSATLPVAESYPQGLELPSFGYTVALDGDTAAVGLTGLGSSPNGVVLIFDRMGEANWVHQATLQSNTPSELDHFGKAVTISGNDLFVSELLSGQSSGQVGQVSLFTRNEATQWEFVKVLTLPDFKDDRSPSELTSADNTLLVPSTRVTTEEDGSVTTVGVAHVVKRSDNGEWHQTQTIDVSDTLPGSHTILPRLATNDLHIAAQLFYYGRWADGDGTYGSLQNQQIRIFDQSADGEYLLSHTIETDMPGTDPNHRLDIGFAGADIVAGGTLTDLLIIKDDSGVNGDNDQSSGGGVFCLWALALFVFIKRGIVLKQV